MSTRPDMLPPTARAIALLLSSTPSVQDAQPGVLLQLLEFAHRYAGQVLTDATVYSEHAGRNGKIEMDDVTLAVQARVGWEFGGRVPKEHMLSLANQINAVPLPAMPEVFGVRIPTLVTPSGSSSNHTTADVLTAVDFDLLPNEPPPGQVLFDEYEEEETESDSDDMEDDDDDDMEAAPIPAAQPLPEDTPFPISAIATEADLQRPVEPADDDDEELFSGGDDDDEPMDEDPAADGQAQRQLVEEDDYD
ncbi:transcription initiation factor IID, 31kD subunit-domain-containing protein [Flagelloscypha sp. PMI_526]|nr:transcription initiation factor IID, 31kD subunit-domain-containing protein [Flagelloscypha sp. PMI_526]